MTTSRTAALLGFFTGFADRILGKSKLYSWRRLVVWLSSIPLLCFDKIDQWVWLTLSLGFIGGEVYEKYLGSKEPGSSALRE